MYKYNFVHPLLHPPPPPPLPPPCVHILGVQLCWTVPSCLWVWGSAWAGWCQSFPRLSFSVVLRTSLIVLLICAMNKWWARNASVCHCVRKQCYSTWLLPHGVFTFTPSCIKYRIIHKLWYYYVRFGAGISTHLWHFTLLFFSVFFFIYYCFVEF